MEKRIETLERQRIDVSDMNGRQCRQIRRNRSVKADPREIAIQPKNIRHHFCLFIISPLT
jgi:hypothetical protein